MSEEKKNKRGYAENVGHQTAKGIVNAGTAIAQGEVVSAIGETLKLPFRIIGAVAGVNREDDD